MHNDLARFSISNRWFFTWCQCGFLGFSQQAMVLVLCCSATIRFSAIVAFLAGLPPPIWTWASGLENNRPKGEIGILTKVELSNILPADRCFLYIEHEGSFYIGCLLFDDTNFCGQVATVLNNHCNQPISEIGSLDISHTL